VSADVVLSTREPILSEAAEELSRPRWWRPKSALEKSHIWTGRTEEQIHEWIKLKL